MNKYEEALKDILDSEEKTYSGESVYLMQQLVERATPMKPIIERISAGSCGMTYENYQCPNCKHGSIMVGNYKDRVDYCHDCGQCIDWSETDEYADDYSDYLHRQSMKEVDDQDAYDKRIDKLFEDIKMED